MSSLCWVNVDILKKRLPLKMKKNSFHHTLPFSEKDSVEDSVEELWFL